MKKIQFVLVFLILISCQEKSKDASIPQENIPDNPVFELISTSQTGINFENTIKNQLNFQKCQLLHSHPQNFHFDFLATYLLHL